MRIKETPKRFTPSRAQLIGGALILSSGMIAYAVVPNQFTAGTPISAAQMNANFASADGRINTLEASVTGGNIVLAPSTAITGNILKDGLPFLHNFGSFNTFIGSQTGNFTMTGTANTATGASALSNNTTGNNNSAYGVAALQFNTVGTDNTAIGARALDGNTSGFSNTASGSGALANNTSGNSNTASGVGALDENTTGFGNTALGAGALSRVTTGTLNTAIGLQAGTQWTGNDSNNIAIGSFVGSAGDVDTIRIGRPFHTRAFITGIRGITTGVADAIAVMVDSNGQLGTISSSRRVKDDIADMAEASSLLMRLRPVTFHYKSDKNPKGRSLQYGLIAEEVENIAPGLVARSANGEIETVFYQHLAPMLLNEYQKQQRVIEAQSAQLKMQAERVAALEKQGQEIVALRQELARVAAILARAGKPDKVASAGR